jgi:arylsulfatase A-like enzyme
MTYAPEEKTGIGRRGFLAGSAAAGAALALGGLFEGTAAAAENPASAPRHQYTQPNIVLIVVDEMRYPREFPKGIKDADEFIATYMPNLHQLWRSGVKFGNHFTNGTACSPARATFVTGLYPLQQWLLATRTGTADQPAPSPALGRGFPTYGKLLRKAGYRTPYVGKWHLSPSPRDGAYQPDYLSLYGFEGLTQPDILGDNGDGYYYDGQIAARAAAWLQATKPRQQPFCLTASFVNPHDKQFFWAGTEANRYNALYSAAGAEPLRPWTQIPTENRPRRYGYRQIPANWEPESALADKPSTHAFARDVQALVWGGVTDSKKQAAFTLQPFLDGSNPQYQIGTAPWEYWEKSLDSYTQMMVMVDQHIGTVLDSVPKDVARNTVFIMMSDHGEYAGAHGMVSGKIGTAYDEAFSIPMVVADPRGVLTGDIRTVRQQLTSSVDLLPMLVSIAHGGRSWLTGDMAQIYGERLDLLPLLKSNKARGRSHLVWASGEQPPKTLNYDNDPLHIYVMRTHGYKVAAYARWVESTTRIDPTSLQYEFYDYATERGRLELDNTFHSDPRAKAAARDLLTVRLPLQLEQRLPPPYQLQSDAAKARYLAYQAFLDRISDGELRDGGIARLTAWGANF